MSSASIKSFFKPSGKRKRDDESSPAAASAAGESPATTAISDPAGPASSTSTASNEQSAKDICKEATRRGTHPALFDLLTESSWRNRLQPDFSANKIAKLQSFLHTEWETKPVYPPKHHIFRALNTVPFPKVKVVILGQDPYHDVGQAVGWSFSVPRGCKVPSSLVNVYKELASDVGREGFSRPPHGDLRHWVGQGVLLLNTSLTVQAHAAGSHSRKGWEALTDAVIRSISQHRRGVVFLLWGKHAQGRGRLVDRGRHLVLESAHPSGLSAHRGFFGCKHFSQANAYLLDRGVDPIDWQIPTEPPVGTAADGADAPPPF